MKHTTKATIALALGGSLAGSLAFAGLAIAAPPAERGQNRNPVPAATAGQAVASATLAEDLTFMREEERLARDVYAALAGQYDGAAPMANITKSEQRHYDAVGTLLTRYGLEDPSKGLSAGDYFFDELDTMYADLMKQGGASLQGAYGVGVAIEEEDIADLKAAIARTTEADAKRVFENLLAGSQNHLAAFEAAAEGKAVGTRDGSGMQNGRGQGNADGRGQGNGQGNGPANGMGPANGAGPGMGRGMGPGTGDPADCPNS